MVKSGIRTYKRFVGSGDQNAFSEATILTLNHIVAFNPCPMKVRAHSWGKLYWLNIDWTDKSIDKDVFYLEPNNEP